MKTNTIYENLNKAINLLCLVNLEMSGVLNEQIDALVAFRDNLRENIKEPVSELFS